MIEQQAIGLESFWQTALQALERLHVTQAEGIGQPDWLAKLSYVLDIIAPIPYNRFIIYIM